MDFERTVNLTERRINRLNWLRSIGAIAQPCMRCNANAYENCKPDCRNYKKFLEKYKEYQSIVGSRSDEDKKSGD